MVKLIMRFVEALLLSVLLLICSSQVSTSERRVRCNDPGRIKHVTKASNKRSYRVGSKLLYRCHPGYEKENNAIPICTKTGKWDQRKLICNPISCDQPSIVQNGNFTGNRFIYRSRLTYTCNYGYKMVGRPYRICKKNGNWSKKPICKKHKCRIRGRLLIMNGRVTATDPTYYHGSTLVFECNKGFELVGEDTITCLEGKWNSRRIPYCKAIACPNPGYPENGRRLGNSFRVGRTVRFACQSGFEIRGSRSRTCLKNKHWSGALTVCDNRRSDCPVLGSPVSGYKIGNRYNFWSIIRFRCKRGYVLEGSSHRLCTSNRTWNGTEAKCVDEFEHLVRDTNQTALLLRHSIDSMLEHTCSGGNNTCNLTGFDMRSRQVIVDLGESSTGLDVLFIFDASSSIKNKDFELGVDFAKKLVEVLGPTWKPKGTRIASIVYATEAEVVFNFGDDAATSVDGVHRMLEKIVKLRVDPRSVKRVPQRLKKDGILRGGTASATALKLAAEVVFASRKSKGQRVIFFITDGMSNIGGSPIKAARILRRKYKVKIYAIGVGNGGGRRETEKRKRELHSIASEKDSNVIMVKDYKQLLQSINKAVKIEYDYRPCGESDYDSRARMVGGYGAERGRWPWQVGIYILGNKFGKDTLKLLCGGALVKPGWVLTAAHCLYDTMKRPITAAGFIIRAGDHELPEESEQEKQERVLNVFPHRKYNSKTYENDIALIRLKKPFKLSPSVRLICLPDKTKSLDRPGHGGYVAGWGTTKAYKLKDILNEDPGKHSPVLLQSYFEIQQDQLCKNSTSARYKDHVNPDVVFCAGDGKGGNDTCQGDSGGSFMRNVKQGGTYKWVSVGLVSWGEGCGMPNKYGFYTRVAPFLDWINETIQ